METTNDTIRNLARDLRLARAMLAFLIENAGSQVTFPKALEESKNGWELTTDRTPDGDMTVRSTRVVGERIDVIPAPSLVVTQAWTHQIPLMQQTVLLTAIRGPDGVAKYHQSKFLLRWLRRCVLLGALDHNVFTSPGERGGGSFTGPSFALEACGEWEQSMMSVVDRYLQSLDELPHHFQMHFMHAAEIIGYKHPDDRIRLWWHSLYVELVRDLHLSIETEAELDFRLGDSEAQWRKSSSLATQD
ncbi:MAG: hypothetical protein AAF678_12355 [Pseudomonadota bacterium]